MKPPAANGPARPAAPDRARDDVLGDRLRANLARRKAQARARAPATDVPSTTAAPSTGAPDPPG